MRVQERLALLGITAGLLGLGAYIAFKPKSKKKRSCWVRTWLLRRQNFGHYETLLRELAAEDPPSFRNYTRVDVDLFQELADLLSPKLQKKTTHLREPISASGRLAITLRYLATGMHISWSIGL